MSSDSGLRCMRVFLSLTEKLPSSFDTGQRAQAR